MEDNRAEAGTVAHREPGTLDDRGRFILHKFQQPIGEETYEIVPQEGMVSAKVKFRFNDRGEEVALTATFRGALDLTPSFFEAEGKNCRQAELQVSAQVEAERVRVRIRDRSTERPRPFQFFTIAGYAPITLQMLLVRYWEAHRRPTILPTFPGGSVRISPRGKDSITIHRRSVELDHYSIEGLIWGREHLWFDSDLNLVAVVTLDAEFDHFEAIREGFEEGLSDFITRAGADGMASLAELAERISGTQADLWAIVGGTLIDGTDGPTVPDSVVLVRGGRLLAVGPRSEVRIPDTAQRVAVEGKCVLPGLWDMHAHFQQVEWGPIYLAAGVTTVRDCGNELEFITSVRDAIAQGRGLGPRILAAGVVDGRGPL
ncbi:MAG: amidohydrolase, partial [Thermoplasmata archaeon]